MSTQYEHIRAELKDEIQKVESGFKNVENVTRENLALKFVSANK